MSNHPLQPKKKLKRPKGMNLAQETIEALQPMFEGRAETFAKKVVDMASQVKVSASGTGKFTKAEARKNRVTLGITSALEIDFTFKDNSDDLPGAVIVTSMSPSGRIASLPALKNKVEQKQFKKPLDFLKAVAANV